MKRRALELLSEGKSQKDVAAKLSTTVTTLRSIIEGEDYPGQRKGASGKTEGPLARDPTRQADSGFGSSTCHMMFPLSFPVRMCLKGHGLKRMKNDG